LMPRPWDLPECDATPPSSVLSRRRWLTGLGLGSVALAAGGGLWWWNYGGSDDDVLANGRVDAPGQDLYPAAPEPRFRGFTRPLRAFPPALAGGARAGKRGPGGRRRALVVELRRFRRRPSRQRPRRCAGAGSLSSRPRASLPGDRPAPHGRSRGRPLLQLLRVQHHQAGLALRATLPARALGHRGDRPGGEAAHLRAGRPGASVSARRTPVSA